MISGEVRGMPKPHRFFIGNTNENRRQKECYPDSQGGSSKD